MIRCSYQPYTLQFRKPGGTSRGILTQKHTWFIRLYDTDEPHRSAWGECGVFAGLSSDDRAGYEQMLRKICKELPEKGKAIIESLREWPSIAFGVETVLADWENGCKQIIFDNDFANGKTGIAINGLIWMGSKEEMLSQIETKIQEGYQTLKMKIGAIHFEEELDILRTIRSAFPAEKMTIRVDANGAFSSDNAMDKLTLLAAFDLHSIEQPIRAGQWKEMARLAKDSPVPIALDEELIGIYTESRKRELLETIQPPYIILKPTLAGGMSGCDEWIEAIEAQGGNWWMTSALESNIGLNAIAQYTFSKKNPLPQGLGTGQLYTNNIPSPLRIQHGQLFHAANSQWDFEPLQAEQGS